MRALVEFLAIVVLAPAVPCGAPVPLRSTQLPPDPHTRAEPEVVRKAGYTAVGDVQFLDGVSGAEIDAVVGTELCWIETENFVVGVRLPPLRPEGGARRRLDRELADLRPTLPGVPATAETVGVWLRAHLFARRCEAAYAAFCTTLGVTRDDFPETPADMGSGNPGGQVAWPRTVPRMLGKFRVVLVEDVRAAELLFEHVVGEPWRFPHRRRMRDPSCYLFVTASGHGHGLDDDRTMHTHVVYNLALTFVDGYLSYERKLPLWFRTGFAQWSARAVETGLNNYEREVQKPADVRANEDWAPLAKGIVKNGSHVPIEELAGVDSFAEFTFDNFVESWSRIEFLMQRDPDGLRRFLDLFKNPAWAPNEPDRTLLESALDRAWGLDFDTLDDAWRRWVQTN